MTTSQHFKEIKKITKLVENNQEHTFLLNCQIDNMQLLCIKDNIKNISTISKFLNKFKNLYILQIAYVSEQTKINNNHYVAF